MYKIPEEGNVYRHYKGGIYEVLTVARHTEKDEELVIYRNVSDGKRWARPLSMWEERVDFGGKTVLRFTLIASSPEEMDGKRLFKTIEDIADLCEMYNPTWEISGVSYCKTDTGEVITFFEGVAAYLDGDAEECPDEAGREQADQIIENPNGYVKIPVGELIDEYEIMSAFAAEFPYANGLEESLRGKGAYRRFRETVSRLGIEKVWYEYRDMKYRREIRRWCDSVGISWQESYIL